MNTQQKGNLGLASAISYFSSRGCVVSLPISGIGTYDLVIDDGNIKRIQCKYTTHKNSRESYVVNLRSTVWGKGNKQVIKKYQGNDFDLLFVLCEDGSRFIVPIEEVSGRSTISVGNKSWFRYKIEGS